MKRVLAVTFILGLLHSASAQDASKGLSLKQRLRQKDVRQHERVAAV